MKRAVLGVAIAAVAIICSLSIYWQQRNRVAQTGPIISVEPDSEREVMNGSTQSTTAAEGSEDEQNQLGRVKSLSDERDDEQTELALPAPFEELVTLTGYRTLGFGDVPQFSAKTEAQLLQRYRATTNHQEKANLWQILAFRGGSPSVSVLTNALLLEFNGVTLSPGVDAKLRSIPWWLGITALKDQSALQFLIEGAEPDFWRDYDLFHSTFSDPSAEDMACLSIKGLIAFSGSSEADDIVEFYLENPHLCAEGRVRAAIIDGFFQRSLVARLGLEHAYDEGPLRPS